MFIRKNFNPQKPAIDKKLYPHPPRPAQIELAPAPPRPALQRLNPHPPRPAQIEPAPAPPRKFHKNSARPAPRAAGPAGRGARPAPRRALLQTLSQCLNH